MEHPFHKDFYCHSRDFHSGLKDSPLILCSSMHDEVVDDSLKVSYGTYPDMANPSLDFREGQEAYEALNPLKALDGCWIDGFCAAWTLKMPEDVNEYKAIIYRAGRQYAETVGSDDPVLSGWAWIAGYQRAFLDAIAFYEYTIDNDERYNEMHPEAGVRFRPFLRETMDCYLKFTEISGKLSEFRALREWAVGVAQVSSR